MSFYNLPSADTLKTFEKIPVSIAVLSPNLQILTASDFYLKESGTQLAEIQGRNIFDVFPDNPNTLEANGVHNVNHSLQTVLRTKVPHRMEVQRYDIPNPAVVGEFIIRYWELLNTPVLDAQGDVQYIIHLVANVTDKIFAALSLRDYDEKLEATIKELTVTNEELIASVEELRESQECLSTLKLELEDKVDLRTEELKKFKFLADNAEDAMILMQKDGSFAYLNDKAKKNWGYTDEELQFMKVPDVDAIHQEDVFANVFALAQLETIPVFETLHKRKDGSIFPVEVNIKGITLDHEPHLFAVARDITKRKKVETALKESEERLNLAVENAEAGVFDTDLVTEHTIRSPKHAQIYGYKDNQGEWTLDKVREHMLPEDREPALMAYQGSFNSGVLNHSFRIRRVDGVTRWVQTIGKVVFSEKKVPLRIIGTVTDITDKKELEKQKDEFISTVSHELKTPVTSIKAYTQFLKRSLTGAENAKNLGFLNRMDTQIDRLQILIHDLLDVTRLDQNKLMLRSDVIQLDILLAETIDELQLITPTHELIILKNDSVTVISDKNRLIQVITNLVTNAVKYSPSGNLVNIMLVQDNERVVFSIQDFGIGIPDAYKTLIFERFHQIEHEYSQSGLSLGLGLYISKEIITSAGGLLWLESEEGKGTTFYFSLPVYNG